MVILVLVLVVLDTTKVQIFKQITTPNYETKTKNQVVLDTTKVQIFKQITTPCSQQEENRQLFQIPQRYRFSSKSQLSLRSFGHTFVVLDTTKVQIFKQITTDWHGSRLIQELFQIPQRYRFSSKSQRPRQVYKRLTRCFRYHKGTDFQANHNKFSIGGFILVLFQIPQRYRFSSKSQQYNGHSGSGASCFRYHKGTDFQANHNPEKGHNLLHPVVLDTTKVQIFKQITTTFSLLAHVCSCFRYHKGTDFQANHNCKH